MPDCNLEHGCKRDAGDSGTGNIVLNTFQSKTSIGEISLRIMPDRLSVMAESVPVDIPVVIYRSGKPVFFAGHDVKPVIGNEIDQLSCIIEA